MDRFARRAWLAFAFVAFACVPTPAQPPNAVEKSYRKIERRIPMRDGTKLFTAIYIPKDESRTYPILLERTPYSVAPYGENKFPSVVGPSDLITKSGYIVAYQDVRGCYMSEGTFEDVRPRRANPEDPRAFDESTDARDTIEWLLRNVPNNNGKVGMWGISYPGFYAAAALIESHPALKAVSPQAPLVDWFLGDDLHHNGAFFLQQEFIFDAWFGAERPAPTTSHGEDFKYGSNDAYAFFLRMGALPNADARYFKGKRKWWLQVMEHGNYDAFWKERALLPRIDVVAPAVMTVGGWFDAEDLYGPLNLHRRIGETSPKSTNLLVMGPWSHGGWSGGPGNRFGPIEFGTNTAETYRKSIELTFFEYHLKGVGDGRFPRARVFETGRNVWREHDRWPPPEARPTAIHLDADGKLSRREPERSGSDEFLSDPAHPVPYTSRIAIDTPPEFMVEDQRFAERRPDVLTYRTGPLDKDVTIAGPIGVDLTVSTTGTDADWIVKVIDVFPDDIVDPNLEHLSGYEQLVRGDVMRGKFRDGFEVPKPFVPGRPERVAFKLQDTAHTFRKGHSIMIQVQSSWFPLVDRNPQTFLDIYKAKDSDYKKAGHRVYRGKGFPSRVDLPVIP